MLGGDRNGAMGEILRNWIQQRLGILIDLTPEVFGHHTRDGTLLAQMLHSYDIINRNQVDTIIGTQDPALCRVNLKHLRSWLRFVGIQCDDEGIEEISCGKGTTSLRLFYKLYLCLETGDRLHFVTLQEERERYVPSSNKFEVSRVSEEPPPYQSLEHPLAEKLCKGRPVVDWHRSKIPAILRNVQRERQALEPSEEAKSERTANQRCMAERKPSRRLDPRLLESRELDRFAFEHRVPLKTDPNEVEEMAAGTGVAENPEMAKVYVEWLKNRSKRTATVNAVKAEMQKALLSELWDKIAAKQDRAVDEAIARRVLDQSRYEKQIVSKLCEVREQRNAMAENQKIVQDITLEARAVEHRASYELAKEETGKKQKDIEVECQRMCELRQRLLAAKLAKIREKHETVCRTILEDLVTIASNIGDHRRINDGRVPSSLLAEWKSLFLKGQPIFVEEIPYGAERLESVDEERGRRLFKSDATDDWEKIEALRSALLDDYLETSPPWDHSLETPNESSREALQLGRMVLGYVAHRLLDALYARPQNRTQSLLLRFKNVAIVLGIGDPTVFESIRALLDNSDVRAIRMEDAINFCLARYKEEMTDLEYVDLAVSAATEDAVRQLRCEGRERETSVKFGRRPSEAADETSTASLETATRRSSSKGKDRREKVEEEAGTREKETQTPRNIPNDDLDPVLTDAAYMGKWAYEFLALGEPICNDLATKILIEYLKGLPSAKGWALIDYPSTYEQMSLLETTLTGLAPPPDPRAAQLDTVTIEDIEGLAPRIVFEDESDPFALNRQSKLVPNPVGARTEAPISCRSFATVFVRVKQQPKYFERGDETHEAVAEDAPSIDKYYVSRGIARVLYYATFDLPTLKILARLVIGEASERKSSDELFGEALKGFEREPRRGPSAKEAVARRLLTEDEFRELRELEQLYRDSTDEEEQQDVDVFDDFPLEVESRPAKPGEQSWQWIDLPLPSALLECLGSLWESMERVYVDELEELLFLKSVHASGIGPYADFVARNAQEYAKRPDTKQNLLREFHTAFNAVSLDARNDADVKCELHRRVAEFQAHLWQLCDERRRATEEERRRRVADDWTVREAALLFNVYVGLIQAEMDRHVDTMRLLQDYYLGMLKKPLPEARHSKVALNRTEVVWSETPETPETPRVSGAADKSAQQGGKADRAKTAKDGSTKAAVSAPAAVDLALLRKEIRDALIDRDRPLESVEATRLFKGVADNVRYARSVADAISAAASEQIRREPLASSTDPGLASRGQDFALEWQAAVAYEIERIRLKLDSIVGVARLDVAFLLETLQRTFHGIYDFILDRYWRETKSVNDMANVFCFAIEEGTVLDKEMLLEGDRFVVRSNVSATETKVDRATSLREVPASPALRFHVVHLVRLMQIFKRVAPQGTLGERALLYILQDLASHGLEEGEDMSLPCAWYQLRPGDISVLLANLFDRADCVDWREFLVYALELPMPTVQEILIARDRFRLQDPESRETVARARYDRTPLWFFECSDACLIPRQLLLDEFQRNLEELYEEELHLLDAEGPSAVESAISMSSAVGCCGEEILRRMLAKELLCQMYMVDRYSVNYTALLLAFCKDEDPRDGFGKALALALGSRVCTSEEDGERYVEELVRRRQLVPEERASGIFHRAALEVAQSIVNQLLHRVEKGRDRGPSTDDSSAQIGESGSVKLFGEAAVAESLAGTDSASSREIDGGEASADSLWERLTKEHETVVHWVSLDLCLTVLAAALPWHVLQPEIAGTRPSFRERLAPIFQELWDPELDDRRNVVLVHRLLNHDSMRRFLTSVSKFTAKRMSSAVREILLARDSVAVLT